MKSLKELDFKFFSSLEGQDFTGTGHAGEEITLKLRKVVEEASIGEELGAELNVRSQPFSLQFVAPRDSLPRQCLLELSNPEAGKLEPLFLVATRQTNEELHLCAVFA